MRLLVGPIFVTRHLFIGFLDQAGTLQASPWAHSQVSRIHVTQCYKATDRRIDPAVERHVGRTHVRWSTRLVRLARQKVAPRRSTQFRIVVSAIDLATEVPPQCT